ncbi:vesicle transport through interaction with t-SNAREs homolog 1A [Garra rufa]|uniref:vesicle transport through interaction with t-SNAREs homolog 1A n=1 Tax=Garra rufa TaxID=137080 RepID=UPI003CCEEDCC
MSSDFEAYEQDFGTLTAEITNKIGRIPKLAGEEKTQLVLNVDKQLEEVRELLEQMDLEVREIPIQSRAMYNSRLKSYKQEIEKLEKDFITSDEACAEKPGYLHVVHVHREEQVQHSRLSAVTSACATLFTFLDILADSEELLSGEELSAVI